MLLNWPLSSVGAFCHSSAAAGAAVRTDDDDVRFRALTRIIITVIILFETGAWCGV